MKSQISVLVLMALLAFSCSDVDKVSAEDTVITENQNDSLAKQEALIAAREVEMMSVFSDLNVRNSPGKDGVVISKLKYGQRAIYLGEETDYKEKIIMRGESKFDSWKKIKFASGDNRGAIIGWVYGGGIRSQLDVFTDSGENSFDRNIYRASAEEVKSLIGVDVDDQYYYMGTIQYTKPLEGDWILNQARKQGKFVLKGISKTSKSAPETKHKVIYSGEFDGDRAQGKFSESYAGSMNSGIAILLFDQGKCISGRLVIEEEAIAEVPISTSSDCSFEFIRDQVSASKEGINP